MRQMFLLLFITSTIPNQIVSHSVVIRIDGLFDVKDHANNYNTEIKSHKHGKENKLETQTEVSEIVVRRNKDKTTKKKKKLVPTVTIMSLKIQGFPVKNPVKVNNQVIEFLKHVEDQSLQLIQKAEDKVESLDAKKKLRQVSEEFAEKFSQHIDETMNATIKTESGMGKIVYNTIAMSDNLMKRLARNLEVDLNIDNVTIKDAFLKSLMRKNDERTKSEYDQACQTLNLCRSGNGMCGFLSEFFAEILLCDDERFTKCNSAMTEVFKYSNHKKIFTDEVEQSFKKTMVTMENLDIKILRHMYIMMSNALMKRNEPMRVAITEKQILRVVDSSLAFLDLLDHLCKAVPATQENKRTWEHILNCLRDFRLHKREDILEIMQALDDNLTKNENEMSFETMFDLREKVLIFYDSLKGLQHPNDMKSVK